MRQPGDETVVFAGGGTGGHIYPNVAIAERLVEMGVGLASHFVLSDRTIDGTIAQREGLAYTTIPAAPLPKRPGAALAFVRRYRESCRIVTDLLAWRHVTGLVVTGGFVAGPAARAATRAGLPVALVNLDATPGVANRLIAREASVIFSAYPTPKLASAQRIGLPIRQQARATRDAREARARLGLDPERRTLVVTAGSQGARTLNEMGPWLWRLPAMREHGDAWQVLHLAGADQAATVEAGYNEAGVAATVMAYCDAMGLVWSAADLAISRAGAGTVGEVWANHVPAVFLPYPYHRDQHQRHNAQPLVDAGGARMLTDQLDGAANARRVGEQIAPLLAEPERLAAMRERLEASAPPDGAGAVAAWLTRG